MIRSPSRQVKSPSLKSPPPESNREPLDYKSSALPVELGGQVRGRNRTPPRLVGRGNAVLLLARRERDGRLRAAQCHREGKRDQSGQGHPAGRDSRPMRALVPIEASPHASQGNADQQADNHGSESSSKQLALDLA